MKTLKHTSLENGALTHKMDVGSDDFKDFQLFILSKSKSRTEGQKMFVELLGIRFKMEDYLHGDEVEIISIGQFLKALLSAANIRQNKFAEYIGMRPSNFSKLLSSDRKLSIDLAIILGSIFDIEPLTWISIQTKNEIRTISHAKMKIYSRYRLKELLDD
jgi:antitoxin HigA-1